MTNIQERGTIPTLFSAEEIQERMETLAAEIAANMPREFILVALLRGSFMFTADLVRALYGIGVHPMIDFMTLSSYGTGTRSSGAVHIGRDMAEDVTGKDVLIIDDILETGNTLKFAQETILERGAKSIKTAMLLEKPGKLEVDVKADFIGFTVPDKFVIGYGLDYASHYRELPFIGYLDIH